MEPSPLSGKDAELSRWRHETPPSYFHQIAEKFKEAGIRISAYDFQFRESFTDTEIGRELGVS